MTSPTDPLGSGGLEIPTVGFGVWAKTDSQGEDTGRSRRLQLDWIKTKGNMTNE